MAKWVRSVANARRALAKWVRFVAIARRMLAEWVRFVAKHDDFDPTWIRGARPGRPDDRALRPIQSLCSGGHYPPISEIARLASSRGAVVGFVVVDLAFESRVSAVRPPPPTDRSPTSGFEGDARGGWINASIVDFRLRSLDKQDTLTWAR